MTEQPDTQPEAKPRGKLGKVIFILLALAVVTMIVMKNRTLPPPKGWINNDLTTALAKAEEQGRNIVILFVQTPPSKEDIRIRNTTLSKAGNIEAIAEHDLVAVMVRAGTGNRDTLFEEYGLSREDLPAMIILSPTGRELGRHNGFIGELNFRDEFLKDALD